MPSELELACEELTSEFGAGSISSDSLRYLASGAAKDIYRLDKYPGLVLAVSRSVRQNHVVDEQHRVMCEMAGRGIRVVPFSERCFDAPGRDAMAMQRSTLVADRRAYVMRYIDGAHVFPLHGVGDAKKIPLQSALFKQAARLGILGNGAKRTALMADLCRLFEHCSLWTGSVIDLQGFLERETGHFYLSDPSPKALTADRPRELSLRKLEALIEALQTAADPARPGEAQRAIESQEEMTMSGYTISANHQGTMTFVIGDSPSYDNEEVTFSFLANCGDPSSASFMITGTWTNPFTLDSWVFELGNRSTQPPPPGTPPPNPPDAFDYVSIIRTGAGGSSESWSVTTGPAGRIAWVEEPDSTSTPWVGDWVIRADAPNIPNDDPGGQPITVQLIQLAFTTDTSDVKPNDDPLARLMDVFRRQLDHKDQVIDSLRRKLAPNR